MADFAEPYAARVITRLLGMPEEQWEPLARLSTQFGYAFSVTIKEDLEMITHGLQGVLDMSQELIDRKRGSQDDDFISTLVAASVDGEKITEHELLVMVSFLILAGFDTTRNQLGLAMQTFAQHSEQWQLLASEPELARNAVEEVMRVNPTITWVSREAIDDFEYKDLSVPAGTTIHLFSIPAGSDPRKYPNFEFDITAERAPHFGFGGGVHHCLGHFVARIDMREALKTLAQRLPQMRIAPGATYLPDSGNTGPTHLPLEFSPTGRQ
jgi:cytochrome P450